ncbi:MAG: BON domain-containing protein [Chitinivibrionales bacterium]|nr:BON domain-containing protein [Chitinivibrionales bacterium]
MKQLHTNLPAALVMLACMGQSQPSFASKQTAIGPEHIETAVEMRLLHDKGVDQHLVDVQVNDGVVELVGRVNDLLARERAERIAQSVRGVRSVVNELDVAQPSRPDDELQNDVVRALLADPVAESYEIGVTVDNGQVTLEGTVESWEERRIAARAAMGVRGVREVTNRIEVSPPRKRLAKEIEREIELRLELDPVILEQFVEVEVRDSAAILEGKVSSAAEQVRAVRAARVGGIVHIDVSRLSIVPGEQRRLLQSTPEIRPTDARIRTLIENALTFDPRTTEAAIGVDVSNGIVTLTGRVADAGAHRAAVRDARNTDGVLRVVDRIQVVPSGRVPDSVIEESVRFALDRDPVVERHEIRVRVSNGLIRLDGKVDSYYERAHAEDIASRAAGAANVDNRLTITTDWTWRPDFAIVKRLEEELLMSPYVTASKVQVSSDDAEVVLTGEVLSWRAITAAVENAFDAGAELVHNRLHLPGEEPVNTVHSYHDRRYWW